jgi:hypothetical protein
MQKPIRTICLLALIASGLTAADLPFAGKWKMNPSKSEFGGMTMTYEQLAGGEMKATEEGQSFTFKLDGKDYPTPWGTTSAWKTIDAHTWESTDKVNGKVTGTDTLKLSADGKTLTVDSKNVRADGGTSNDTAVAERVSGGPGLAGTWRTKNVKTNAPGIMDLSASGTDGLKLSFVDEGGTCTAKFDGKDAPAAGSMWPAGWTCSLTRTGAQGFDATWKKDGKAMFKESYTVSADGKSLTNVEGPMGSTEKVKIVYDRQ